MYKVFCVVGVGEDGCGGSAIFTFRVCVREHAVAMHLSMYAHLHNCDGRSNEADCVYSVVTGEHSCIG